MVEISQSFNHSFTLHTPRDQKIKGDPDSCFMHSEFSVVSTCPSPDLISNTCQIVCCWGIWIAEIERDTSIHTWRSISVLLQSVISMLTTSTWRSVSVLRQSVSRLT
ncbi:Os08g0441300 [Oryza sativa Japonica Group]|uniref:Os08g0441300 protein n=1 Tax=Oryza sativa subsp. japonica TaxID=39947 RepID=C7J656_ORYSJ|nr:Os08g0441300 [Oryza sativa Japonica Group]|eukprot:NP_001175599.1 Os08g0441300 [Oryza sativa Japonica Group]